MNFAKLRTACLAAAVGTVAVSLSACSGVPSTQTAPSAGSTSLPSTSAGSGPATTTAAVGAPASATSNLPIGKVMAADLRSSLCAGLGSVAQAAGVTNGLHVLMVDSLTGVTCTYYSGPFGGNGGAINLNTDKPHVAVNWSATFEPQKWQTDKVASGVMAGATTNEVMGAMASLVDATNELSMSGYQLSGRSSATVAAMESWWKQYASSKPVFLSSAGALGTELAARGIDLCQRVKQPRGDGRPELALYFDSSSAQPVAQYEKCVMTGMNGGMVRVQLLGGLQAQGDPLAGMYSANKLRQQTTSAGGRKITYIGDANVWSGYAKLPDGSVLIADGVAGADKTELVNLLDSDLS